MNGIRKAALVLMLIWMGFIFFMSNRPADESTQDSEYVGTLIGRLVVPDFDELDEETRQDFVESIDHQVRKSAHASEYCVLGVLAFFVFYDNKKERRSFYIKALTLSFLYAVTDEIHQLFVSGRSGQFSDVLIDTAGAALGLLFLTAVFVLTGRLKKLSDEK